MSHTEQRPRRNWPWVVAVVAAVVVIVVGASVLSSVLGGSHAPAATTTPGAQPTKPTSPTPTAVHTSATPSARPTKSKVLTAADLTTIKGAVEDNDPTDLYEYLRDPVHVEFAASDFNADRTPDNAITDLAYIDGSSGWNWDLDKATLDAFRAGAYGDQFPVGAIAGESDEGYVVAFTLSRTKITKIFVSKSADLVTAPQQ